MVIVAYWCESISESHFAGDEHSRKTRFTCRHDLPSIVSPQLTMDTAKRAPSAAAAAAAH